MKSLKKYPALFVAVYLMCLIGGCKARNTESRVLSLSGVDEATRVPGKDLYNVKCSDGTLIGNVPKRSLEDPKVLICKCFDAKCTGQLFLQQMFASEFFFGEDRLNH